MSKDKWSRGVLKVLRFLLFSGVLFVFSVVLAAGVLYVAFGITSSNSVLYVLRDSGGTLSFTNDLSFDDTDRLLFMVDASCIFSFLQRTASAAVHSPLLELTWNAKDGKGVIKDIRPDGDKFIVLLSRYREVQGIPQGVFIGGDLPYGDIDRLSDEGRNNSSIAFYDGERWFHIWCNINEAVNIGDVPGQVMISDWHYLGSKILKSTFNEVILQSEHEVLRKTNKGAPVRILMTRTLFKKAGEDSVILKVEYKNTGKSPVILSYALGDEPWIGNFGEFSSGDVGWAPGRIIEREGYVLPTKDRAAGFVDIGNSREKGRGQFTGYANFIEWSPNPPDVVFFSDNFAKIEEGKPLDSPDNRIINLLWLNQLLSPGESMSYTVTIGMATPSVAGSGTKILP